jgi:hypothetical protein
MRCVSTYFTLCVYILYSDALLLLLALCRCVLIVDIEIPWFLLVITIGAPGPALLDYHRLGVCVLWGLT